MQYKSDLIKTLAGRGYLYQATDIEGLDALAARQTVTGYIGFDATASSLHVGSLVQIMMLRRLQQAGHTAIVLLGGGTTKIGDPSGKDSQRPVLTPEDIAANKEGILKPFHALLDMDKAIVVDNDAWLSEYSYLEFLREFGRHFTINRMLTFDSVKSRLDREQPLTFLEFNYMLLQGVDFLELNRARGCQLQLGGADQWGNIVNGVELCRRVDSAEAYGFTTPLITTASGVKMGKTADGAVWLNPDRLGPYQYWQFWRNTEDADVGRFLRLFTDLPLDEVERLESLEGADINDAKIRLANEATAMLHGADEARKAEAAARETFEQGGASADLPSVEIPAAELQSGLGILEAFERAELVESRGEARRHIKGGALKVNDEKVEDPFATLTDKDIRDGAVKLSVGKKRHALLKIV